MMSATPGFVPRKTKSAANEKMSASAAKLRLLKTLHCTLRYEKKAWESGALLVAGVDEVGRGKKEKKNKR